LGVDFFLEEGVCIPSEPKLKLCEAWTSRIIDLVQKGKAVITKQELDSFNGTINFGAFAIPDAKIHLNHFFKLANANLSSSMKRKGLCRLHPSTVSHAEAIRELFRSTAGLAFVERANEEDGSAVLHDGMTDANHRFVGYCGMGGMVVDLGIWWYFEFKDHSVLRILKVHILEMLADVVQVAIIATFAPGCRYRGWIDNQSSMFAIRGQTARDRKLMELLYVRHAVLRRAEIQAQTSEFVGTEDNTTDPISQGKFTEFLERLRAEQGAQDMTCIDVARSPLAHELHALIHHLCSAATQTIQ
jgi:hypothetical protein